MLGSSGVGDHHRKKQREGSSAALPSFLLHSSRSHVAYTGMEQTVCQEGSMFYFLIGEGQTRIYGSLYRGSFLQ